MLQVNLSNLSGPELRRLLDATRSRGEAALSYQILQEMAARREDTDRRGPFQMRRPAEPRVIAVDLGDPMERKDEIPPMPAGRRRPAAEPKASAAPSPNPKPEAKPSNPPPSKPKAKPEPAAGPTPRRSSRAKAQPRRTAAAPPVAQVEAEPAPPLELERPRVIDDTLPEPVEDEAANSKDWDVRFRPPEPDSLRAPRRLRRGHAAGFAVGAAAGIALGWWIGVITREAPPTPAATAATPIRTAALARRPQPAPTPVLPAATTPEPPPEPLPEPAVAAPPPDVPEAPVAAPVVPDVNLKATGEAMELPQAPEPQKTKETATAKGTAANACAAKPTPADRQICASPELQRLQRELRKAYAEALQAHQDRALLRERQLAWRDARNAVSDPERLAKLYEQRIRKLNAATAEARRQR